MPAAPTNATRSSCWSVDPGLFGKGRFGGAHVALRAMTHTTKAIVLKVIRHGDHTVVLKAMTEQWGVRSFIVRAGGKSGVARAAMQPLNRLEIVANERTDRELLIVREVRVDRPFRNLAFDPVRGTLALFVQEVLYKVLRGEAADPELFAFLWEAVESMDTTMDVRNYPLVFLLQLSGQLGFRPSAPRPGEDRFDLREGEFLRTSAPHGHTLGPPLSHQLAALLNVGFQDLPGPRIASAQRRELLDHLLLYYRMHIEGLGELRSPAVLHQVLG